MDELHQKKYAELQKLAKKAGIKANQKHEKLIAELRRHYEKEAAKAKPKKSVSRTPNVGGNQSVATISTPGQRGSSAVTKPHTTHLASPSVQRRTVVTARPSTPCAPSPAVEKQAAAATPKAVMPVRNSPSVQRSPHVAQKPGTPSSSGLSRWTKKVMTPVRTHTSATKRKITDATATPPPATKKRRSTFEAVPTPELSVPDAEVTFKESPAGSRKRRSTFEKAPTPDICTPEVTEGIARRRSSRGSGVKDMLGAMKGDMTDQEMKDSLLTALDKKVAEKCKSTAPSSSIPRFAAFLKKRDEGKKPITPGNKNWDLIHKKNFEKFDSIDVYLEKKRRRAAELTTSESVKKAKLLLNEVHSAVSKLKSNRTPQSNDENKFRPKRPSLANRTTPFKPSVTNTSKMDLNFGARKTPKSQPRVSVKPILGSEVKKVAINIQARKSVGSALPRKSINTPFKFTAIANTNLNQTVASTKKPVFDLKASLAKPLTWKPHMGKLKPLKDVSPGSKKITSVVKSKNTRVDRRANVAQRRADKKHNAQMSRRGINL